MSTQGSLVGHRIVPVVVIDDAGRAADLAHALQAGGIHCAEITLRTPAAIDAIAAIAAIPGFTVGAGTVLDAGQFTAVADAGASFVVSPGFDPELVEAARTRGLGILPGIATATEVQYALRAGLDAVKFFPADRLGGLATIQALAAPFPGLAFIPSGGVTAALAVEYLASDVVPAVSGSWMAPRRMIADGDFESITRLSAESTELIGRP